MSTRDKIIKLAKQFFQEEHSASPFIPGKTPVPVSGKVLDYKD